MFENLTDRLNSVFDKLSRRGKLSERDVDAAMREVRMALLEADVHYTVVKDFVARVRERSIGHEVSKALNPGQQVVKIVNEELIATLGAPAKIDLSGSPPHVVMLIGLQGFGKTTTAAKLALKLRQSGQWPLLVAADTRRPAAITQLEVLGQQLDIPVHSERAEVPPPVICANALKRAELEKIKRKVSPQEVLLVADAMTGQDAVRVADEFNQRVGLTGLILTKIDGDARGGAAISIRAVTGVPIKYLGVGEKLDALESFHPDRLASRILGMGDVLTLIEKAEEVLDQEQALAMGKKLIQGEFDLEDFLGQLHEVKKLGPLSQLLEMVPGFSQIKTELTPELTDRQMKMVEAIINSMTVEERRHPRIINASRRRRIARGSGTTVQEVNMLLGQFRQMQRMMKQLTSGRGRGLLSMFR